MVDQQMPEQHQLTWKYLAHSEVGLVRKNNQDSGLVSAQLLMVADGMGGAAAGDLASAVAVDTMAAIDRGLDDSDNTLEHPDDVAQDLGREDAEQAPEPVEGDEPEHRPAHAAPDDSPSTSSGSTGGDRLHRLAAGISAANTRIADLVATDYSLEGMGTTVTAAVLDGDAIGLAHIGDSRGYLFRNGELSQLTHDHSWVQSLIDDGKISEEEAAAHPHRSLLLKVLNGQPANEPDLSTVQLRDGDRLLLCSDGLCGFVEDDEIAEALDRTSRDQAMRRLVDAAHAAGGLDNITIVIADLLDADSPAGLAAAAERDQATGADDQLDVGAVHQVDGPGPRSSVIGAAAEHDIAADEQEIQQRAADRDADDDEYDDEYDEYQAEPGDETDDEARYAPQPPAKRRWQRPLLLTLVVLLVVGAAAAAGYAWTRTQYYVGADKSQVAIFQGLNESVPGIPLSRVYEVQPLRLADLPAYYQGMVRQTIDTQGLASARATVQQLRETAARCAEPKPDPSPSPTTKPTATSKSTSKSTAKSTSKSTSKSSPKSTSKSTTKPPTKPAPTSASPTASPTTNGQLPGGEKC